MTYPPTPGRPRPPDPADPWSQPSDRRPVRRRRRWPVVVCTVVLAMLVGVGGVWADAFGVRERVGHLVARVDLVLNPPEDRTMPPTIQVTPPPDEIADDAADPSLGTELVDAVEITPEPDPTPVVDQADPAGPSARPPRRPTYVADRRPRPDLADDPST